MNQSSIDWLRKNFGDGRKITKNVMKQIPSTVMEDINVEFQQNPEYQTLSHIVYCFSNDLKLGRCVTCGKTLTYYQTFVTNNSYCSNVCIDNKKRMDKVRKAFLEKYGVDHISQSEAIKEKKKQKSLLKYGVENVAQSAEIREKMKQTTLERYGVEYSLQSESVREKGKQTSIRKYGCEYGAQSEIIKDKIKSTNIERYGCKSPAQNRAVLEKMKKTCLERFGVDNVFKDEKLIRKNLDKTYDDLKKRFAGIVIPLFSKEEYTGHYHDEVYRWKCVKCGEEFEQKIYNTSYLKNSVSIAVPRCMKCYPFVSGFSREEKEVLDFVKSIYSGEVIENDHSIISPYELDIYIPEKHVAIEFDGIYWHTEAQGKDEHYHLMKTEMCKDNGIHLIHIFEHEWNLKQEIVKDRINSVLGVNSNKLQARKCIVKTIESRIANNFLEENHLQGRDHSSIQEGLFFNDELVAVMTFGKPRFSRGYDFELIRFATKIGCHIIGGASKLLNHFRSSHSGSIVSYADRRYSDGHLYEKLGFSLVGVSKPNYVWMKNNEMLTRYQCQKHRLSSVLGDGFDESESESQNMARNGWNRIYDCGNLVYKLDAR